MYTRCPKCSTCFRVTDRHLAIAKGKVRCGQCQLVFNALDNAIDDLPAEALKKPANQTVKPASTSTATKQTTPSETRTPIATEKKVKQAKPRPATKAAAKPATIMAKTAAEKKQQPVNNLDKTIVTDTAAFQKVQEDKVDLDNFDIDAAIDEITRATEKSYQADEFTANKKIEADEKYLPSEKSDDVFSTDQYETTSAGSVEDILNEMEGQLSLDIPEPGDDKAQNINKEFDFINLDIDEPQKPAEKLQDIKTEKQEIPVKKESSNQAVEKNNNEASSAAETMLFEEAILSDSPARDAEDDDIPADAVPDLTESDIPYQLRTDIENLHKPEARRLHPLLGIFLILFLVALSFTQAAYFRSHQLAKLIPEVTPYLEKFCLQFQCRYSGPADIRQIQILSRDVRQHPHAKNALLISAAMINNADFSQPYPDIHIRLSDISGNIVAERIFSSKTYLGKLSHPFLLMKSKTPVHINFEVVDPGRDAVNFEFIFL